MKIRVFVVVAFCALALAPASAGAETRRLTDLERGKDDSNPEKLAAVDRTLFFAASSPRTGTELFKTKGRARNTRLVRDVNPGPSGTLFRGPPTGVAGTLLFRVRCPSSHPACEEPRHELWRSDGTGAGTTAIEAALGRELFNFSGIGGRLFFHAVSPEPPPGGVELWASDGTAEGTNTIVDHFVTNFTSLDGVDGAALGGVALLAVSDDAHGVELWRSDGTLAGTELVADLAPGPESSTPRELTSFAGGVYFLVGGPAQARPSQLWRSDGTAAGTVLVKEFEPEIELRGLTAADDRLYFIGDVGEGHTTLWASDGTGPGTSPIREIRQDALQTAVGREFAVVGSRLFFSAFTNRRGNRLWTSDGTKRGTRAVKSSDAQLDSGPVAAGNDVYFAGFEKGHGNELWRSGGQGRKARLVRDIRRGRKGSRPQELTASGGRLYFTADDREHGRELWVDRR